MSEAPISNAKNELVPTTGIFDLRLYAQVAQELENNPDFLGTPELRRAYDALERRVGKLPDHVLDEVELATASSTSEHNTQFAENTQQGYSKH